jgi:ketosteroid isomerase-like protein
MTTKEIADAFTALCRDGKEREAADRFWSDDVVSIEAMEGPMARLQGREAVLAKHAWWAENAEMHGGSVEGPWVNGDQFAVRFTMDVTMKGQDRSQMAEIALYTVKGDKVVEERFFS